jgi:hypothetical protein
MSRSMESKVDNTLLFLSEWWKFINDIFLLIDNNTFISECGIQ